MAHNNFLVKIILISIFIQGTVFAQNLYVKEKSGEQTSYLLSNVGKLTFSSQELNIFMTNNSSEVYPLESLKYLIFNNLLTGMLNSEAKGLSIFPNPVSDELNISLSGFNNPKGTFHIINIEGKLMGTYYFEDKENISIDVSYLAQGIYICNYITNTEVKSIKFIKR